MIDQSVRQQWYADVENRYPLWKTGGLRFQRPPEAAGLVVEEANLNRLRDRRLQALNDQLRFDLLLQLHTLFDVSANDAETRRAMEDALNHLYRTEAAIAKDIDHKPGPEETDTAPGSSGHYDAVSCALIFFRKYWYEHRPKRDEESLLGGLDHVSQAGFFRRVPLEIASWAQKFLLVERYHRLDPVEHEKRLDRYHWLQVSNATIHRFEDLLILLEQGLLQAAHDDLGLLSREMADLIENRLAPALKPDHALSNELFVLLKCHQFCLTETVNDTDRKRLAELLSTRRMDSVVDLMRLILHRVVDEHELPDAGTVLDQLQADGFNINHEAFRDPYEAPLVSIEETERFEATWLRLFLVLEKLSGDYDRDLMHSRQEYLQWHQHVINELLEDHKAYRGAVTNPLPRSNLVARVVRFLVSWVISRNSWPPALTMENLIKNVQAAFPDQVKSLLVRPRKGYEMRSRQQLNRAIESECSGQLEAIKRISSTSRIDGLHDYRHFIRYVLLKSNTEPDETVKVPTDPSTIMKKAEQWGIDTIRSFADTPQAVRQYLLEMIPCEMVTAKIGTQFDMSEQERQETCHQLLDQLTPAFYRLLVAYGRHQNQLPRLPLTLADIPLLVQLLAPPFYELHATADEQARKEFTSSASAWYRQQNRSYLLDQSEREAYLSWVFHRTTRNINLFDDGDEGIDLLIEQLEKALQKVDVAPYKPSVETVPSLVFKWLRPQEDGVAVPQKFVFTVARMLPQMHCGACGFGSCPDFARALIGSRANPTSCPHLPQNSIIQIGETLRIISQQLPTTSRPVTFVDLLKDPQLWRTSPHKEILRKVLSPTEQKARRIFIDRFAGLWRQLTPKPEIYKEPDTDTLYRLFRSYLGAEATERLRDDERRFLITYGDLRLKAERRSLQAQADWLRLSLTKRQSYPVTKFEDPAWVAEQVYRRKLFLNQLSDRDRELVIRRRLDVNEDGFRQWWNEDLLLMNHPEFSITNWEDFAKIIKNAYWHQESSMIPGEAAEIIRDYLHDNRRDSEMFHDLLGYWLDVEKAALDKRKELLRQVRTRHNAYVVSDLDQLRDLIEGLALEKGMGGAAAAEQGNPEVSLFFPFEGNVGRLSPEDHEELVRKTLWERFQGAGFTFAPRFSCHIDDLSPNEKETLEKLMPPGSLPQSGRIDWDTSMDVRVALIKALISATADRLFFEEAEYQIVRRAIKEKTVPKAPVGSLRIWMGRSLAEGQTLQSIMESCVKLAQLHRDWQDDVLTEVLHQLTALRQYEMVRKDTSGVLPPYQRPPVWDEFFKRFPQWKVVIDEHLRDALKLDRERLLHSLYLLAKMEGDLDVLTALLREIRETSDVMEAAWLNFTQERLQEGPFPRKLPGTTIGIPLLAARVKNKDAVNRCLREGLSRSEKRDVAAAVRELILYIRYHVLRCEPDSSTSDEVARDFWNAGYDLTGIDPKAINAAIDKEWNNRDRLQSQKIWIVTMATARRIAAQDPEYLEVERSFHKIRLDILKEDGAMNDQYETILSRRGVALGRIKEETYRELSDLLEQERLATFRNRIGQIVHELDLKRLEIHQAWVMGDFNRRSIFYLLRRLQKEIQEPTWADCQFLLRDQWFHRLEELRSSRRPDRDDRIRELDEQFEALFGISPLLWEREARQTAEEDFRNWLGAQ